MFALGSIDQSQRADRVADAPSERSGIIEVAVARLILVEDSASARKLLAGKLRGRGYEVEDFPDGVSAVERALTAPPSAVITDLMMPGLSGVQLCRLLQADPITASVPVILLTASGDRRSRFWARSAGAVGYVAKSEIDALLDILPRVVQNMPTMPPEQGRSPSRGMVQERLSELLDGALFDSVIAGEVRALASAADPQVLFAGLSALVSEVLGYRWLALSIDGSSSKVLLNARTVRRDASESEARTALGVDATMSVDAIDDDRAVDEAGAEALVLPIVFGETRLGQLAVAPSARGVGRDERKLCALFANELSGPLRLATLVEETKRMAATDALTGLLNRRAFLEAIERERSRSRRHALPVSILLLDVDHFKKVNDTHGHAAGDAVLQGVAKVLMGIARKSDFVGRFGGEEFVVTLPQTSEAGARIAAERIRRAIEGTRHAIPGGGSLMVTASIGLASAESPWGIDDLVQRADRAMYAAKGRGRNRVEIDRSREEPG